MAKVSKDVVSASVDLGKDYITLRDGFYRSYPKVPGTKPGKIYADHLLGNLGQPIQASWAKSEALKFVVGVLAQYTKERDAALMNIAADRDPHYKANSAQFQPSNCLSRTLQIPGGVEYQLYDIKKMLEEEIKGTKV